MLSSDSSSDHEELIAEIKYLAEELKNISYFSEKIAREAILINIYVWIGFSLWFSLWLMDKLKLIPW